MAEMTTYPITGVTEYLPASGEPLEPHAPRTADELASAWLLGYSGATREAYAADLRDWARWLASIDLAPLDVHRAHVDAYTRRLAEQGRSKRTVARRLAALAGFYSYAVDEDLIGRSPVQRVRRPKVGNDSPRLGLDRDELAAFLRAAETSRRDHALACLLALNGLRVSSALAADVTDLSNERGHRTLMVTRKGDVLQLVPLAPRTAAAVDEYVSGRVHGPLFVTRSGARLDRHAAQKTVRRLARDAGITKPISPHSLRHTFVTQALDAGASLRDVQDAAGHADPRTTRRYDRGRHSLDRHPTYAVASRL